MPKTITDGSCLADKFPEIAEEWDYERNGDLKPSDVSAFSKKEAWWLCQKGHSYKSRVYNRVYGHGCPICFRERLSESKKKKVICVETGAVYPSIGDAAKAANINSKTISACCGGRLKTAAGYHWKYAEEIAK